MQKRHTNVPREDGERDRGYGLSLVVRNRTSGGVAKFWVQRLRLNDKLLQFGLGMCPSMTLVEAKAKALRNGQFAAEGTDPRDMSR